MKKKSDNLSSGTTTPMSYKSSLKGSTGRSKTTKKSSSGTTKASAKSKSSSAKSKKAAVVPRSQKPANVSLSPVTALKSGNKPKHSNRNIGVKAKGRYIKTLYELTRGKEGEAEREALKGGLRQIQNLANKRIEKLVALEKETGVTAPALHKLRQTGFAHGVSLKGYGTDSDQYREQYKAFLDFLKDSTSTREGVTRNIIEIEQAIRDAGWRPEGEEGPIERDKEGHVIWDRLHPTLSADQYEKFKALAEKFYDEHSKYKFYLMLDTKSQDSLQSQIGQEIIALLDQGDLDTVLQMAEQRLQQIYRENASKF